MKEQDFLFIGPQAAGKTCIMNALLEKDIPKDPIATRGDAYKLITTNVKWKSAG